MTTHFRTDAVDETPWYIQGDRSFRYGNSKHEDVLVFRNGPWYDESDCQYRLVDTDILIESVENHGTYKYYLEFSSDTVYHAAKLSDTCFVYEYYPDEEYCHCFWLTDTQDTECLIFEKIDDE